jgi:hypothetical protein
LKIWENYITDLYDQPNRTENQKWNWRESTIRQERSLYFEKWSGNIYQRDEG